jgi:hypothetical protein
MHPDRRGAAVLALLVLSLTGCATAPQNETDQQPHPHPALLELAGVLPGHYLTPARAGSDHHLQLEIIADPSAPPDRLRLLLIQTRTDRPEAPARQFQWQIEANADDGDRLHGEFAPMDAAGRVQRRCSMRVNLRRNGLSAQTDPEECSFGEGEQLTGLIKEIAFDGSQLVIGDRLVSLPSGEPAGEDQITRFLPGRAFSGWAGVREGDAWRMASALELATDADQREPRDASGMTLGIRIDVRHYEMARSDQVKLRLSVSDAESGDLLGEAWADADARAIGIALPDLQVGLEAD